MHGTTIKSFTSNKYVREFDSKVDAIERRIIPSIRKYYKKEYYKGIDNFIETNVTGYENLFKTNDVLDLFQDIYIKVGFQIANWYFRSFERYRTKADPKPFKTKWQNAFSTYGSLIAAYNAPLVSGTAKKTLIKLTERLYRDPEFQALGNQEQARILRGKFNQYSDYQARRLVRTESTRAANYAIEQSSLTMFPAEQLSKRWLNVGDAKVRNHHQNISPVRMNEDFVVGGEYIKRPGEGSAKNTINCRCRMIVVPDEDAVAITEMTDIGIGVGQARIDSFTLENITNTVAQVAATAAPIANAAAQTFKEVKDNISDIFSKSNIKVRSTTLSTNRTLDQYNEVNEKLRMLMNKYNYDHLQNNAKPINIRFKTTKDSYGYRRYNGLTGQTITVNLGDRWETISRMPNQEINMVGLYDGRWKSIVDEVNFHLATPVHEMAHVLTSTRYAQYMSRKGVNKHQNFFDELDKIYIDYKSELEEAKILESAVSWNKVFLGRYAQKNIDEFLAEGFTEYHLSSNPSKYAILIGKLVEKYYGK